MPLPEGGVPLTEDALLGGRVRLRQPAQGYRAAIDPVLLAAAVPARPGERVVEAGCGAGAAALCLLARLPEISVLGLEIQPEMAALARLNAGLNDVADRFQILDGDVAAPLPEPQKADHVMMNPPFLPPGRGTAPPGVAKAVAHIEGEADLPAWVGFAARQLKHRGSVTIIHRADRLADTLAALALQGLGSVVVLPLWPGEGKPAKRVIVQARKGGRAPLVLLPGLILHRPDGGFTDRAEAVLRDAASLRLD
ncbi:MAG: methyltransferase [Alphaproteobacteria bacterium]|nr:methyltransferase [Alphaproteobacteria bacterium]MBU0795897.1 methyltransferase [Alphaproteobacteria bacterium]MBU0887216.1 methyltransferase [Alphaproteobacteria bacterium]MBU1812256.1 methyltransferase [Alphaproteobacteria bacterium]